ncbi:hypothetical protein EVAR_99838_1 [Eumeta japonica]|uniref:Mariner Mos1 transposase n=1 Tax=Eumeta variegata TaxID=151549 RepID=A0A4C1ZE16_EUMVA|nr:hypothetical protein EVAR_99838_1 [Eumeta japonica]
MYDVLSQKYQSLINQKRVLLQDNARLHTTKVVQHKIEELGGTELLAHPAPSPVLAPGTFLKRKVSRGVSLYEQRTHRLTIVHSPGDRIGHYETRLTSRPALFN